jgi:acyl-CoA synthetase (NDP forming)
MERERFSHLFNPSSLAIAGAFGDESKAGNIFLRSLVEGGFEGRIYPVNKTLKEAVGLLCYPSVRDIPHKVDLAIIVTPAHTVLEIVQDCIEKGIDIALVVSVGFAESGMSGKALESQIVKAAIEGKLRIVGPNTMGIYCPCSRINTLMPALRLPSEDGGVSFVGQSGWISENFFLLGRERGLRFSKVVDSGNESDLAAIDFIEYFAEDPNTRIIGSYVEGIKNGRDFVDRLKKIRGKRPIIMCKGGKTEAGSRSIETHTGSLSGSFSVFSAALHQSGVIMAQGIEELVDFSVAFVSPYLPQGNRLGLIIESGGAGTLAVDMCESQGLLVAQLNKQVKEKLRELLVRSIPSVSAINNPVDLIWPPYDESGIRILGQTIQLVSESVDAILLITYHLSSLSSESIFTNFLDRIEEVRKDIKKPIVLVPGYVTDCPERLVECVSRDIPCFLTPEQAVKAISALLRFSRYTKQDTFH